MDRASWTIACIGRTVHSYESPLVLVSLSPCCACTAQLGASVYSYTRDPEYSLRLDMFLVVPDFPSHVACILSNLPPTGSCIDRECSFHVYRVFGSMLLALCTCHFIILRPPRVPYLTGQRLSCIMICWFRKLVYSSVAGSTSSYSQVDRLMHSCLTVAYVLHVVYGSDYHRSTKVEPRWCTQLAHRVG